MPRADLQRLHERVRRLDPFGSWPPYDYRPLAASLREAYQEMRGAWAGWGQRGNQSVGESQATRE